MSDVSKIEVGNRIKNIRKTKGDNLDAFGAIFGVSKSNVSKWENGKQLPNNERLKKIAELGSISIDQLLYGTPKDYLYKNLKIDTKSLDLEYVDEEIKIYLSELVYNYVKNHDDVEDYTFDQYLKAGQKYIPIVLNYIINLGKQVVIELNKKSEDILTGKRDSVLINKTLNKEKINNVDFVVDYPFIVSFSNNDYLFPKEVFDNDFNNLSKILNEYFRNYKNLPLNEKNSNNLEKLKENSYQLGLQFEKKFTYDTENGVGNKLSQILKSDIPKFVDGQLSFSNKLINKINETNNDQ
ncbi:helix-turn-helix domain-containing protein [Staphylococcus gallinarum]|uniref:helix-turn-helix domain-containing protein n=1 Tax=Staphylococcus gallinarum TaxID=1293 RepID=UPI001E43FE32|nr:helix-turn-helix domain-containing protein [Staphylococcus gallinarum]MCD8899432.1 helix-turn-helix domain-containing protein [Staphylococcus gallinarum]